MQRRIGGIIVVILCLCFVRVDSVHAQIVEQRIAQAELIHDEPLDNLADSGIQLSKALERLEEEYDISFMYQTGLLPYNNDLLAQVSVPLEYLEHDNLTLILKKILEPYNLTYSRLNNRTFAISFDLTRYATKKGQKAQEQIQGLVTDAQSGETLPGVNVIVKGTTTGTSTDSDGAFELTVESLQDTLIISFVGYQTQEVPISGRTEIEVALQSQAIAGEELVVVGYGTQEKRHLTGSIGSIDMDETLSSIPTVDFGEAMYGKIAGVQVFNPSGRPGESSGIQIRGINSISAGTDPLIVVDGIPMPGFDLNTINSSDIESIDVLKDASSAAIYGSRGSNGVIQVTTRSGSAEESNVSFNYSYSLQRVMNKVDVMNGPEYAQAAIDAAQNGWVENGGDPDAPNTVEARGDYIYTWPEALENPEEELWNTDFQDLIYRVAPMHKGDLSFSGGNESSRYFASVGFLDQEGIVLKSDYQKYSMNIKADTELHDWLTVGGMLNVNYDDETVPHPNTSQAGVQYPSIYPVYGNEGYLGGPNSVDGFGNYYGILIRAFNAHPLHWNSNDDERQALKSTGNVFTEIGIMPGLNFRSSISVYYNRNDRKLYQPGDTGLQSTRTASTDAWMNRTLNYTLENLLTYNTNWKDHQFDAVAGYEFNKRDYYSLQGSARDYDNDLIPYLNAANEVTGASNGANESALISVFGRLNYNFMGKYLASISFRRDGSSRFGPDNKWGNFPSFSAGWRLGDEEFVNRIDFISNLTIRASYGFTGNDNIGNYRWISSMNQGKAAFDDNLNTTYYPSSVENSNLRWERTRQMDIGLDMGLFNDRIHIEGDFYRSESDGLLLDVPVPETSGFISVFRNIGALENTGVELSISTHNLTTETFSWTSNINFASNRGEITALGPDDAPMIITRTNMSIINQIGEAPFSFYAYEYDGVYMNQQEIDNHDVEYDFPVHPGDGRYKDINGDGVINSDDRTIIGNAQPDFTWALTNNFQYKNFDFSFLIHGSVGGDFYFADNRRSLFYHEGRNYLAEMNNRWRSEEEPGDGYHYKLSVDTDGFEREASSYWTTDGTYTWLKNITLGYRLPTNYTDRIGIKGARIYINGTNLLTLQSTSAIDPENISGSVTDPAARGIQHSPYPSATTYSFGLNIQF